MTIQTAITLCAAYLSFFMGESESTVSGVLCCVSAALVLAKHAWPIVNSHEALENVWHALEYFGNTVLFFLAGVITQRAVVGHDDMTGTRASVEFTTKDYLFVVFFYLVMMCIRAVLILTSYPLLKVLGTGTTPKDAAFMVWAGLRGAVGLALALLVLQSGGDQRAGLQVRLCVSGLAFLTLIINGITAGPLLPTTGACSGSPRPRRKCSTRCTRELRSTSVAEYRRACLRQEHDAEEAVAFLTRLRHLAGTEAATPLKAKNSVNDLSSATTITSSSNNSSSSSSSSNSSRQRAAGCAVHQRQRPAPGGLHGGGHRGGRRGAPGGGQVRRAGGGGRPAAAGDVLPHRARRVLGAHRAGPPAALQLGDGDPPELDRYGAGLGERGGERR